MSSKLPFAIAQNISWMLLYRVVKMGLAFFVTAWLARYLGPEKYGTYVYAIAVAELVMFFWTQGLKEVVIKEIKVASDRAQIVLAGFGLMMAGSFVLLLLLGVIVSIGFSEESLYEYLPALVLVCGVGILFRSFEAFELWFHARLKVYATVLVQFLAQLLFMGVVAGLILSEASLIWFGVAYAGQLFLAGIGFWVVYQLRNSIVNEEDELDTIGELRPTQSRISYKCTMVHILKEGKYMIMGRLLLVALLTGDRIIIEYVSGAGSVGFYTAAMKMVTAWIFIATSISLSFMAPLAEHEHTSEEHERLGTQMFGLLVWLSLPTAAVFSWWAVHLVPLVFGDGYSEAIPVFQILAWSLPFLMIHEGIKVQLLSEGKSRAYFMLIGKALFILAGCMYVLTMQFDTIGAAMAFVITWFSVTHLIIFLSYQTREAGKIVLKAYLLPFVKFKSIIK